MAGTLRTALATSLGSRVSSLAPVAGGDINQAFRARLADGREVFVKRPSEAEPALRDVFLREAEGLAWLDAAGALRLPKVLHASADASSGGPRLVLEWIETGPRPEDFDEILGRGLASLHRAGAPSFGLDRDNFIGPLPQPNQARPDWASFYRELRLLPQLRRAREAGRIRPALARRFDVLLDRLEERVGPAEPPARLHGVLWGGNLLCDAAGRPCLVDPAVYGGHREIDLAMMRLFGGFGERCFDAYEECFPLAGGHRDRVALYQLYPLLVHLNLFGEGYAGALERTLAGLL